MTVTADAGEAVGALLPRLRQRSGDTRLRERIRTGLAEVEAEWRAQSSETLVAPYRLLRALQQQLGPETIFTTDSGNGTFLAVELLRLDRPRCLLAPVDYSCMGYAVPAALGAALASPSRPVVALAGDGAFLMTGLELLTAVAHKVPLICVVLRDGELAQIAQFQQTALNRKTASTVHNYHLHSLCAGLGVECIELDSDAGIPHVVERAAAARAAGRVVVVDAAIDYSHRTWFTRGVVKTNLLRLAWPDRLRFIGRALGRRLFKEAQ